MISRFFFSILRRERDTQTYTHTRTDAAKNTWFAFASTAGADNK